MSLPPPLRRGRLALLVAAALAVVAALCPLLAGAPGPAHPLPLSVPVVGALLVLAELGRMHLEVRRSALTVTLSDAACVLALLALPPGPVVVLRAAVCAPVLLWLYRRSPVRLAVNGATLLLETATCAVVLTLLAGRAGPLDGRAWLAAVVAVQAAGALSGLVVHGAISLSGERQRPSDVLEHTLVGAALLGVSSLLGIVGAVVVAAAPHGRWLLLPVLLLGALAYRAYARLRERKSALEAVHAFSGSLDPADEPQQVLATVLARVPDLVGVARLEVVLLGGPAPSGLGRARRLLLDDAGTLGTELLDVGERTAPPLVRVVRTAAPLLLRRRGREDGARALLAGAGAREALLAPLVSDGAVVGVLVGLDRLAPVRPFRRGDLLLLETIALHAGVAYARARSLARQRYDAEHDALTGLLDREGFLVRLRAQEQTAGAVLVLRLVALDDVAQALGRGAADELLRRVADLLRTGVRPDAVLAHLGTEEFAVYVPDTGPAEARVLAGRLVDLLGEPVGLQDVPVALEVGVGVACGPPEDALLARADIAVRRVRGREGVVVHEPGMDPPSSARLAVAAELRGVLADPDRRVALEVHYQPKADLPGGEVRAVEALVRWRDPVRGLVPPGEFMPVVEQTGLLRPLTLHVLDTALRDAARWAAAGRPLVVAVNLSARSLQPDLLEALRTVLARHRVPPDRLTLEITESALIEDPARAALVCEEVAALGVRLSVDDFGTGWSSLSYLARLPVSEVKVDRSFVSRMTRDPRDLAVVRSVVDLGHRLGLQVVAEGVEDQDAWDAVVAVGCDTVQGFFLTRALPAHELDAWLDARAAAPAGLVG
jgi:diguanylate cyclase (GGDEF)-like protein